MSSTYTIKKIYRGNREKNKTFSGISEKEMKKEVKMLVECGYTIFYDDRRKKGFLGGYGSIGYINDEIIIDIRKE